MERVRPHVVVVAGRGNTCGGWLRRAGEAGQRGNEGDDTISRQSGASGRLLGADSRGKQDDRLDGGVERRKALQESAEMPRGAQPSPV